MKGKTQPMIKKSLLLLGLLLVSCTNNDFSKETRIYYNVSYRFNLENHNYTIKANDKTFNMPPKNRYDIEVYEWRRLDSGENIFNEYFVETNELFVYKLL